MGEHVLPDEVLAVAGRRWFALVDAAGRVDLRFTEWPDPAWAGWHSGVHRRRAARRRAPEAGPRGRDRRRDAALGGERAQRCLRRPLGEAFTVYLVNRRPGLPQGFTLAEMADAYATDHPDLVRRLVLHSSAHTLNDDAKRLQLEYARLGGLEEWRAAFALLARTMLPRTGPLRILARPLSQVAGWLMSRRPPKDASDMVVTVRAEDALAFLAE